MPNSLAVPRWCLSVLAAATWLGPFGCGDGDPTSRVWTAGDVEVEAWYAGSMGSGQFYWRALATELTPPEEVLLWSLFPVETKSCYDAHSYSVIITDRSGARRRYYASECSEGPALSFDMVAAIASCPQPTDGRYHLAIAAESAPVVTAGRCFPIGWPPSGDQWARVTVQSGERFVATVANPHNGGTSPFIALRLFDSTSTTMVAEADAGAPLELVDAGEYLLQVHPVAPERTMIALDLRAIP